MHSTLKCDTAALEDEYAQEGLTVYVEVCHEIIRSKYSQEKREDLYEAFKIEHTIAQLKSVMKHFDPTRRKFLELLFMNSRYAGGKKSGPGQKRTMYEGVKEIFWWAFSMDQWGLALTAGVSLLKFNFDEGTQLEKKVKDKKGHQEGHLKKTYCNAVIHLRPCLGRTQALVFRWLDTRFLCVIREAKTVNDEYRWKTEYIEKEFFQKENIPFLWLVLEKFWFRVRTLLPFLGLMRLIYGLFGFRFSRQENWLDETDKILSGRQLFRLYNKILEPLRD